MHYLHKTLNDHKFFLHFGSLITNPNVQKGLSDKVVRFLYRSSCLFISFHYMKKSINDSIELAFQYMKQIKFGDTKRITFSCSDLFLAYSQIPAALSALVLMQNEIIRIIPLIAHCGKNIPKSMNQMFDKGLEKYEFTPEIEKILTEYWENGGKYIRDLRNINEHYDILVNHTYFGYDEPVGMIKIFLPDNPEIMSPRNFTYQNENVANDVIFKGMNDMVKLVNDICEPYDIEKKDFLPGLYSHHIEDLNHKEETTLNLMISVESVENNKKALHAMEMRFIGIEKNGQPLITYKPIPTDNYITNK